MGKSLTVERLRSVLWYDAERGKWWWLAKTNRRIKAGAEAGCRDVSGRLKISVDGRLYRANRLAWFYMKGEWPAGMVDHADRDLTNDRWENLRDATRSQNCANSKARAGTMCGLKGVGWHGNTGKWMAKITRHGREYYLGLYDTPEAAHAAYAAKATELFGEFARAA